MSKFMAKVLLSAVVVLHAAAISGAPTAGAGKELVKDGVPFPICPPKTSCKVQVERGETALLRGYFAADSLQSIETQI